MGYGILEGLFWPSVDQSVLTAPDKHLAHVPGTILLDGQSANREAYLGNLKHGTGRYAHIVLAPQPSEDPNDPLNWPMWRKEMIFLILNFGAMLYGATNVTKTSFRVSTNSCQGPLLNSSLVVIAGDVGHSINDIAIIGGYNLLVAGCCGYELNIFLFFCIKQTSDLSIAHFLDGMGNGQSSFSVESRALSEQLLGK